MSAPRFSEQIKLDLLIWCHRHRLAGAASPSDRAIATRFKFRSTDDALALIQELTAEGKIEVRRDGSTREIDVIIPPAPAEMGTAPLVAPPAPKPIAPLPVAAPPVAKPLAAKELKPAPARRYWMPYIKISAPEQAEIKRQAAAQQMLLGDYLAQRLRATASVQASEVAPPGGKPFLRAAVIRAAQAAPEGFWPFVSALIDAGLAARTGSGERA